METTLTETTTSSQDPEKPSNLWDASPAQLAELLAAHNRRRGFLITAPRSGRLLASHPALAPVVESISEDASDFDHHQAIFLEVGQKSGHLLGAFLHQTHRGQGAGGVRFWGYERVADFISDGLRLSRAMGLKNALAGLWWGGGKGVIARQKGSDSRDPSLRDAVFADYGRFISGLRGCYITAEDVGTTPEDMVRIHGATRYITCVPPTIGGSGNPSILTARGVVVAMEAALEFLDRGTLEGKTVAMQGLGNVASYMIGDLLEKKVARILGSDIAGERLEAVRQRFPNAPLELRLVAPDKHSILATGCDIIAPNAVGGCLNPKTIPTIQAPIVCGAANNQLAVTDRDGRALAERGCLYVPDFLANRMGIVNCANEQYGAFEGDPAVTRHLERDTPHGIFQRALEVFQRARASGRSTAEEAERLATELSQEQHPIWSTRGQEIIDHLVVSGWDRK